MPTRRLRLTRSKAQDYRTRLLRLKEMGIPVKDVCYSSQERKRLTVQLAPHECARIFEFLLGEVAVVVPVWITVHTSGAVITDCEMKTRCDDVQLDVRDPDEIPHYRFLVGESLCLNRWLMDGHPLRPRLEKGVIVAHGRGPVPSQYHDDTCVTLELLLTDERGNELPFVFEALVDRSQKRKYAPRPRLNERVSIFGRKEQHLQEGGPIQPPDARFTLDRDRHRADWLRRTR